MKKLILLFVFIANSYAIDLNYFNNSFEKGLKKDQFMDIIVHDRGIKKLLRFRWTLFHNNGLVTILNYHGRVRQHILYTRYQENSIRLEIALRDEENSRYHPYMLITFLDYDYKNESAKIQVLHKDSTLQTTIELKEARP